MNGNLDMVLEQLRAMRDRTGNRGDGILMAMAPIGRDLPDGHVLVTYAGNPDDEEIAVSSDVMDRLRLSGPRGSFELTD